MIRAVEQCVDVVRCGLPVAINAESDLLGAAEPDRIAISRARVRHESREISVGDSRRVELDLEPDGVQASKQCVAVVGYQECIVAAVVVDVEAAVYGTGRREVRRGNIRDNIDRHGGGVRAAIAVVHRVREGVDA